MDHSDIYFRGVHVATGQAIGCRGPLSGPQITRRGNITGPLFYSIRKRRHGEITMGEKETGALYTVYVYEQAFYQKQVQTNADLPA